MSEFSYISTSSSNDHGNATVSIGNAQRMRESFRTHFNAVAFGFFNENVGSGTTPVNAETGATTVKNEKACTGTTPFNHAETGATGETRNELAGTGTTCSSRCGNRNNGCNKELKGNGNRKISKNGSRNNDCNMGCIENQKC